MFSDSMGFGKIKYIFYYFQQAWQYALDNAPEVVKERFSDTGLAVAFLDDISVSSANDWRGETLTLNNDGMCMVICDKFYRNCDQYFFMCVK